MYPDAGTENRADVLPSVGFQEKRKADVREERGAVAFVLLGQFPNSSFSSYLSSPNKVIALTKCCQKDQETQSGSDDRNSHIYATCSPKGIERKALNL